MDRVLQTGAPQKILEEPLTTLYHTGNDNDRHCIIRETTTIDIVTLVFSPTLREKNLLSTDKGFFETKTGTEEE
jgi:hypothetical protein